jgi:adenosylcobinamide-GDP ribazoletransferase
VSAVRDGVRSAIAALTFLTAVPVGRRAAIAATDLGRGLVLFPVVGAAVGAAMGLVVWGTAQVVPPLPAAVLAVAAGVLLTGALHLDGLADIADGVGAVLSGRDPTEVMADPRLGTFGGAALTLDLLLKASVFAAFATEARFPWDAIAAGALARMSILGLAVALPYAGPDDGTGAWTARLDRRRCLAAFGIGAAIAVATSGLTFLPMVAAAGVVCAVVGRWSSRHLDGMRGDTFGAAAELTETLALTAALAMP